MDYYQVLRVAPNASRKEIEQAYQRLLKESRYDTSIDRKQLENAYRILSNLAAKSQYDTRQTARAKRTERIKTPRRAPGMIDWIKRRTLTQLLVVLFILLPIAILFYSMRFGYLLKEFHAGDILYEVATEKYFGKVLRVEKGHRFGSARIDAYQVELDPRIKRISSEKIVWLPQESVKARCYKKYSQLR